ncbi:ABC transporter permease [Azospirillum sp. A26]|uniref:ABC transporter permease n=1 Tax=Azospirillum sp. A26 TaxID=3160607 RepID=UPI00366F2043
MTPLQQISRPAQPFALRRVAGEMLSRLKTTGIISALVLIVFAFFAVANSRFTNSNNLINILNQSSYLMIVSLGQGLVLISGGFDLAVATLLGLTSVVSATLMIALAANGVDLPLAIAISIAGGLSVGMILGLANGVAVAYLNVPSFIVTLGVSGIAAGAGYQISGGAPVTGLPEDFIAVFGTPDLRSISTSVYIAVLFAIVLHLTMTRTRLGRYIYAVGGNPVAARLSGINVKRHIVFVFMTSGVLASLAGILLSARVSTGDTNLSGNFVLQSITAGVLGGISLRGGEGTLFGAALGALFIAVLSNGMNLENISSYYQMIILGGLLVLAVLAEQLRLLISGRR